MGFLAIFLAAFLAALNLPTLKYGLSVSALVPLLFFRFAIAFGFFFLVGVVKKVKFNLDKNILKLSLVCTLIPLSIYLIALGLKDTTVSNTNAILIFSPVLTAILAVVILKETISDKQFVGMVISIIGLFTFLWSQHSDVLNIVTTNLSNIHILLSVLLSALYTVSSRRLSSRYSPFQIAYVTFLASFIFFAVLFLVGGNYSAKVYLQPKLLADILYLSIFGTAAQFYLFQYGINKTSAFFAGLLPFIQFPIAVFFGSYYFADRISALFIVSSVLTLGGAFLAANGYKKM